MVVLGLLLLLAAGALTAGMALQNTDPVSASLSGQALSGTVGGLFLAGVVTGAVAILGVLLMLSGLSRRRARRAGLKQQVREARVEKETLAEENARLQRELEASRAGADAYPTQTYARHAGSTEPV